MITIIHGDDIVSSREYLLTEKTKNANSLTFDGETVLLSDLVQVLESDSLFGGEKRVFIEDFFARRKAGLEFDAITSYFKKSKSRSEVFFWEGKELGKKYTNLFPNASVKLYKLPQEMFSFLDSIGPKNGSSLVKLFHNVLKNIEVELVFYMLVRQFRLLLAVSEISNDSIDEVGRLAPWQMGKLQRQASSFSKEELKKIYQQLYQIDLASKTGGLSMPLSQTIDFFLLGI